MTDRCSVVGNAYVLKYIIHDWDDARAAAILARCREAKAPGAVRLIIEHVLPERLEAGAAAQQAVRLDLQMLVMTPGGRERTADEFGSLLGEVSFELRRVIPTQSPFSILESMAS